MKRTKAENNRSKKQQRLHNTLPNMVPNTPRLRPRDLREPVHVCPRLLIMTTKQTAPSWTQMHGKTSISLLSSRLNCI